MVIIEEQQLAELINHSAGSNEITCGAITGFLGEDKWIIQKFFSLENEIAEKKSSRFMITPVNYLKAEEYAANHGLGLLGFYYIIDEKNAELSELNLNNALPGTLYLRITSLSGKPVFSAWTLNENKKELVTQYAETVKALPQLAVAV